MALAQSDASACVLLLDAAQLAFAENSAVPLQVQSWELEAALNPGAFALPLRLRNRQRVAELKKAGFTQCLWFGPQAAPPYVQRVVKRLILELVESSGAAEATGGAKDEGAGQPQAEAALKLSAHANALAKVANQFRQVPPHATGFYRVVWALPQTLANSLGFGENATELALWINGLAQRKCYLYVVVLADEGHLAKRALFTGSSAFQKTVENNGGVYLGRYSPEAAADRVVGAIAHADILFFNEDWAGSIGQGLGKTQLNLAFCFETLLPNRNAPGGEVEKLLHFNAQQVLERVSRQLTFLG